MGRRKSRGGYKIKQKPKRPSVGVSTESALNKTQKSRKGKKKHKRKANQAAVVAKVEKGLSEICSGINSLEFATAKTSKIPTDLSYKKNPTETFLRQNGIDAFQLSRGQRRNSKKRTNRIYSMVQMISALPSKEHETLSIVKPAKLEIRSTRSTSSQLIQPAKFNVESTVKTDKKVQQQERMLARRNKTAAVYKI